MNFYELSHKIFTNHIYDLTNFFVGHNNQLVPDFLPGNRQCQQQSVDWHAIRCLSHCPAATHAREPLLRAKMSICPPRRCESSPPFPENSSQRSRFLFSSRCYCADGEFLSVINCFPASMASEITISTLKCHICKSLQQLITTDRLFHSLFHRTDAKNKARVNSFSIHEI